MNSINRLISILGLSAVGMLSHHSVSAEGSDIVTRNITIDLTLPELDAHPYHKPFVAVWLETPERQPVETIAIWYDDAEWLKDLRQWWRKLGRSQHASSQLDGLSGATQKPGTHTITWQGDTALRTAYLNIEVVREEGGRSYHREAIDLTQAKVYEVDGSHEYGPTKISVQN